MLFVNRFTKSTTKPWEKTATCPPEFYTLGTNLHRTRITALVNGRQVFGGEAQAGVIHIAHPGDSLRFIHASDIDVYHMFISRPVLVEMLNETEPKKDVSGLDLMHRVDFRQDRKLFNLFRALAEASQEQTVANRLYTEGLSIAVVARLLSSYSDQAGAVAKMTRSGLTGWQLKLIQEFIEAHVAQPISLRDLANVVNLSRMHFAAQFLQTTGLRPHEYLLQERIRKAQQLLTNPSMSIVEVAVSVGFETQSHFSTVFKRLVGDSPARWRSNRRS